MQNDKYCICVSGDLGFIVLQKLCRKRINIECVLTDSHSDSIVEYCAENNLKCFKGNPRGLKASNWLDEQQIAFDYLLSINYLFILEKDILDRANVAVNFHGSLLPKYRGRTPHVWAIINGEKECGITAHLMNSKCDDGDIVKQLQIAIDDDDTGALILGKYKDMYPGLVDEIVTMMESGNIPTTKQDITKATYYGKRTPEDGEINWDWQKERIRNWVRAQAKPYPGAFTHLEGEKFTIHKIVYSELGYENTTPNGTIIGISGNNPVVKTQNGAIEIVDFEGASNFIVGKILKSV